MKQPSRVVELRMKAEFKLKLYHDVNKHNYNYQTKGNTYWSKTTLTHSALWLVLPLLHKHAALNSYRKRTWAAKCAKIELASRVNLYSL